MYKKHSIFKEPSNKDSKIWKFLDFTKFISLLETESLYFARADKLADPFEGSFPKFNVKHRPKIYREIPPEKLSVISDFFKQTRQHTFLNCWHKNEYESAAMWNLYLKSNEGIAVQSTFEKLKNCFNDYDKDDIFIGEVRYIDYQKEWMPEDNTFYPFIHKRKSFEHEKEIRAVIQHFEVSKETGKVVLARNMISNGYYVPVNIKLLIEKVYVSPTSPDWIYNLVKSLYKKYNFNDEDVKKSSLSDDPVF